MISNKEAAAKLNLRLLPSMGRYTYCHRDRAQSLKLVLTPARFFVGVSQCNELLESGRLSL